MKVTKMPKHEQIQSKIKENKKLKKWGTGSQRRCLHFFLSLLLPDTTPGAAASDTRPSARGSRQLLISAGRGRAGPGRAIPGPAPLRLHRRYKSGSRSSRRAAAAPLCALRSIHGERSQSRAGPRAWGPPPDMPPSPLGLAVLLLAAAGRSLPVRRVSACACPAVPLLSRPGSLRASLRAALSAVLRWPRLEHKSEVFKPSLFGRPRQHLQHERWPPGPAGLERREFSVLWEFSVPGSRRGSRRAGVGSGRAARGKGAESLLLRGHCPRGNAPTGNNARVCSGKQA